MKKRFVTIGIILAAVCALVLAAVLLLPEKPADNNSLTILQQPVVSQGTQTSVGLTAEGDDLRYRWYVWDEKTQTYVETAQTGAVYYPEGAGTYKVYCVVTDAKGNTVQSETVLFTVKAPEKPHTHSYTVEETPATCTKDAVHIYRCACGEEYTQVEKDSKLPHAYGKYRSNGDATCKENGTETAKCKNCKATKTRTEKNSKLSHSFTVYHSDNNATCTEDGTETARCDNCDAINTRTVANSKLSHSFTAYHSDNNATCTADGTETAKCDNCEATDTRTVANSKLPHSFTAYHSDNNATCTEDGTETAKCDNCDAINIRTVKNSKLPHSFTAYHSDNNATCTADGTETAKCDNCEATDTRTAANSKLSHSFTVYHSDNNATCTADGTETAKCDHCEATDTRTAANSKLSHSFTAYHSDNNATCTADGTETAKCDHCEAMDTRVEQGSRKGHHYVGGTCQGCGDTPVGVRITKQPANVTVVGGLSGSVTVTAAGDGLTYEWYYKDADSDSFVRASATGSTYTITMTNNADGRLAYCIIRDCYDNWVQSNTVTFTKKTTSSGSGATGEEGDIFIPF